MPPLARPAASPSFCATRSAIADRQSRIADRRSNWKSASVADPSVRRPGPSRLTGAISPASAYLFMRGVVVRTGQPGATETRDAVPRLREAAERLALDGGVAAMHGLPLGRSSTRLRARRALAAPRLELLEADLALLFARTLEVVLSWWDTRPVGPDESRQASVAPHDSRWART